MFALPNIKNHLYPHVLTQFYYMVFVKKKIKAPPIKRKDKSELLDSGKLVIDEPPK